MLDYSLALKGLKPRIQFALLEQGRTTYFLLGAILNELVAFVYCVEGE